MSKITKKQLETRRKIFWAIFIVTVGGTAIIFPPEKAGALSIPLLAGLWGLHRGLLPPAEKAYTKEAYQQRA